MTGCCRNEACAWTMGVLLLVGVLAGCGEAGDGGDAAAYRQAGGAVMKTQSPTVDSAQYDVYRSDPDVNGAVPMQKNTSAQAAAYARPNAYDD